MYPTISFRRSLVYTAVLTAFTFTFSKTVLADEAADPAQNSDIQLIQTNESNIDDRSKADNLAYIRSQGQGGVVLKGADATGIVQQIIPDLVNRGNSSDYLSNVLDLTINNDNIDSQNTFYISQIGGSWLVMNVNGENNTVRIADLAGIGFKKADAKDANTDKKQAPAEATKINITGDHNDLTLTPSIVGNIARKMKVTMDEGQGLNQYNILNISYSDFSDIVIQLSNASYSTIDVTQTDFTGDVDEVSSNPNIVFIDVVDADNTTVVLNQTGLGNNATLNVTNDFNTITLIQESAGKSSRHNANISVDGNNNSATLIQESVGKSSRDNANISIDGHNNSVNAQQKSRTDDFSHNDTLIDVQNGDDNVINILQESSLDWNDIYVSIANSDKNTINVDQRGLSQRGFSFTRVNIDNGSRNNVSIFQSSFDDDFRFHDSAVTLRINGSDNKVDVHQSYGDMDTHYLNWLDLNITGDQNLFSNNLLGDSITRINGNHNTIKYSNLGKLELDKYRSSNFYSVMDITGNRNHVLYVSDSQNMLPESADIDIAGNYNTLLLTPSISNSTYSVNGDDNYLSMTGHADELSSSLISISGNDNTVEMDVAGLDGALNINFSGDNNVMGFELGAGDLDYTLTGSGFIGAVKTVGSAYFQQLERLGTGGIEMSTSGGVVNISSNCGQTCGNAI